MFCPNCGTKNDGVELPCKKCGFKLSGAGVPKFRGTMMLHAEQSVQELIDEHRRKQAEEGAADAPAAAQSGSGPDGSKPVPPRSGAPLFGMPGTPQALQPPRAGLPKRRMGTMMGVAPQVGGVQPPEDDPIAGTTSAPPEAASPVGNSAVPLLDPLGGTEAVPVLPLPTAASGALVAGRTEAFEAVHVAPPAAAPPPAAPTPAASASPAGVAPDPAWSQATSAAAAAPSPAPRRTEPVDVVAQPARRTEPLDSVAPPPQRRRVRPLDVFLIVITFGLYGFVLLWRQRRKPPSVD